MIVPAFSRSKQQNILWFVAKEDTLSGTMQRDAGNRMRFSRAQFT